MEVNSEVLEVKEARVVATVQKDEYYEYTQNCNFHQVQYLDTRFRNILYSKSMCTNNRILDHACLKIVYELLLYSDDLHLLCIYKTSLNCTKLEKNIDQFQNDLHLFHFLLRSQDVDLLECRLHTND